MDDSFENGQIQEISNNDGVLLKRGPASFLQDIHDQKAGSIHLVRTINNTLYIEWRPNNNILISDADTKGPDEWSLVDTITKRQRTYSETIAFNTATNTLVTHSVTPQQQQSAPSPLSPPQQSLTTNGTNSNYNIQPNIGSKTRTLRFKLNELKHIEVLKKGHTIKMINKNDINKTFCEFFFQHGNAERFIRALQSTHCLHRNRPNTDVYEIIEHIQYDDEKLKKTFSELKIEDIKSSSNGDWITNIVIHPIQFLTKVADVYTILPTGGGGTSSSGTVTSTQGKNNSLKRNKNQSNIAITGTSISTTVIDCQPRYVNAAATSSSSPPADEYELLAMALPKRELLERSKPLDVNKWHEQYTADGRISNVNEIKELIFRGGVDNLIRSEVWKYLLDYFKWSNTTEENYEYRAGKTKEYYKMKVQWLSMTKIQEKHFTGYRDRKIQIDKDVLRTDRTDQFYAGDNNPNLTLLKDILMTYAMYNFDLGYVQGMSDILAPILTVLENEVDAFWCFVGFMDIIGPNFDIDETGMKRQLQYLNKLLAFVNPKLFHYFESHGTDNMYVCFRWLLVWFKREFSSKDIMELWEILWTGRPCDNYQLLICVAILDEQMNIFIENNYEFNDILKHINELSMQINLKSILQNAEAIYRQIKTAEHLTNEIRQIIGEPIIMEQSNNLDLLKDGVDYVDDNEDDEDDDEEYMNVESMEETILYQQKLEEAYERSMHTSFY